MNNNLLFQQLIIYNRVTDLKQKIKFRNESQILKKGQLINTKLFFLTRKNLKLAEENIPIPNKLKDIIIINLDNYNELIKSYQKLEKENENLKILLNSDFNEIIAKFKEIETGNLNPKEIELLKKLKNI